MAEEAPRADHSAASLREHLLEITQALEALRARIDWRESQVVPPTPPPDAITPADPQTLHGLEDVLAIAPSSLGPAEVFGRAMERMAEILDADRSMLLMLDPERARLVAAAARGFRQGDLPDVSIDIGEGLIGRSFQEGRVLAYARPADANPRDGFVARFPVRDAIAVPVRGEGRGLGVLYVGRRGREAPFTRDEIRNLLVIADRIASAATQQVLAERAAGHLGRLRELEVFSGQALVGRELAETLARACEVGCRLLGARIAALGIPDGAGALGLGASSGVPADVAARWRARIDAGLAGEMLAVGRPMARRDVGGADGPRAATVGVEGDAAGEHAFLRALQIRACLVVPLRVHDKMVGALYLGDTRARDFLPDEVEAAQVLASLAALAIENDRLYGEVRNALRALTMAQERLIQSETTRALGGMAGGVAHEFNNILAIVLGKTQLMLARAPDDSVREGLGLIEEAAWRAADVVRRLQGFAATRSDDSPGLVDVAALTQDAMTLTRPLWKDEAEARGVRIDVVTDLEPGPAVLGSAAELREAVTNVILNAIDAMPQGGRLGLATRASDGGVEVAVSDSGEGMSEETRRRIFEPFFSTRTPIRSGLGLSVVYGIVTRHRGHIDVVSEERRGTRVTLWLPAAAAAVEAAPARVEAGGGPPGPASILVIDDEAQLRAMLVDALAQAGHRVESAADGLAGLARFQSGAFDVVITDLSLPERSGLEVARAVKGLRPSTPVVLITGWGHLVDPGKLREHGVDLTVVKPFRLDRVLAVVNDALRLRPVR